MIGNIALNLSFREFQALCCLFEDMNFSNLVFPKACGFNELETIRFKVFMLYQDLYSTFYSMNPDLLTEFKRQFFGRSSNNLQSPLLGMISEHRNM